jgi:signal transduction histidine kinase
VEGWVFDQSAAVVVLVLFVLTLIWLLKRSFDRIQALETRNDELSASLRDLIRSSSAERAARATDQMLSHESILRTTLASLESALLSKRAG